MTRKGNENKQAGKPIQHIRKWYSRQLEAWTLISYHSSSPPLSPFAPYKVYFRYLPLQLQFHHLYCVYHFTLCMCVRTIVYKSLCLALDKHSNLIIYNSWNNAANLSYLLSLLSLSPTCLAVCWRAWLQYPVGVRRPGEWGRGTHIAYCACISHFNPNKHARR